MQNEKQFEATYKTHFDAIFRYIYFRLRDKERAKDLTQETFMKTWKYMLGGGSIDSMKAFLFTVARNLILNEVERRKVHESLDLMNEEGFDIPFSELSQEKKSEFSRAMSIIAQLGSEYEEVMRLRFVEGLSIKEIAELRDEQESAVAVRIHRGLKQIKNLYQ
ncbi:MAG: RNA polymerase sigma factor [bacterium]|nr:RNA polymerase sigma factor [bacterium]